MRMQPETFAITDYLNQTFSCGCGKEHRTDLKTVDISSGALKNLPSYIRCYGHQRVFSVCDCNTYRAAGEEVKRILDQAGIPNRLFTFRSGEVVPDEAALGEIMVDFDREADLILAIGTGTINDICKFLSYQLGLEYFVVATAPSMDGFASDAAALILRHLKTTCPVHAAQAIIGDLDVLSRAPMSMIAAGLGDILGKYTCLADWKISHLINGEYYCPAIVRMVEVSLKKVAANSHLVKSRDQQVIGQIMEALVLTGLAMKFAGNTRPASGSEHHISHFWEMKFLFEGKKPVLHGTKVGIGAVAVCRLYASLKDRPIDFQKARHAADHFDFSVWEKRVREVYGSAADGVIALEKKVGKNSPGEHAKRIQVIESHWKELTEIMATLPSSEFIEHLLSELGAPINPAQVGVDDQAVIDGILMAKEVRNRYTLLQLLWDLGIADEMAQKVLHYFKYEQKTVKAEKPGEKA